jgi:hypothetical protein
VSSQSTADRSRLLELAETVESHGSLAVAMSWMVGIVTVIVGGSSMVYGMANERPHLVLNAMLLVALGLLMSLVLAVIGRMAQLAAARATSDR